MKDTAPIPHNIVTLQKSIGKTGKKIQGHTWTLHSSNKYIVCLCSTCSGEGKEATAKTEACGWRKRQTEEQERRGEQGKHNREAAKNQDFSL